MITNEQTIELLKENYKFNDEFIAKLYGNELKLFKNHWQKENLNTILLENAIWSYMDDGPHEEMLVMIEDFILNHAIENIINPTFKDRAILHAIYNAKSRHTMDYYASKSIEFEKRFALEISEHARLTGIENEYWAADEALGSAFIEGRDEYLVPMPNKKPISKDDCPHTKENLKEAWLNGYGWGILENILCSALLEI